MVKWLMYLKSQMACKEGGCEALVSKRPYIARPVNIRR